MADKEKTMDKNSKIIANPGVILQSEPDDWAMLYNPQNDLSFGLNPVSIIIWNQIEKGASIKEIEVHVRENCTDVPDNIIEHIENFIVELLEKGLATLK